nr:energy transducer TonB [Tahibacter harae]
MPSSSSNAAHFFLLATPETPLADAAVPACAGARDAVFAVTAAVEPRRPVAAALLISVLLHAAAGLLLWQWIADFQPDPEKPALQVRLRAGGAPVPPPLAQTAPQALPAPPPPRPVAASRPQPAPRQLAETATTPPPLPAAASQEPAPVEALPQPAPALSATPLPGTAVADTGEAAVNNATLRVLEWLAQHRRYPASARRARMQGTVEILVVLMPDGRLVNQRIAQSSGHEVLDRAAMDLLRRASPVPSAAFFTGEARQLELRLPVVYQLSI